MNSIKLIYVTTKNRDEALAISEPLVREHLAACTNILDPMTSVYIWKGELQRDQETVLIIKTIDSLVDRVIAKVKMLHSYEIPCIMVIDTDGGNPDYLNWLKAACQP